MSKKSTITNNIKTILVRHTWGVDLNHGIDYHLRRWREVGYSAIEGAPEHAANRALFDELIRISGMRFIPQIFSNETTPSGSVAEHISSMKRQIHAFTDSYDPWFFNAHSGSDTWSQTQAIDFYGEMMELEKSSGIPICHETHRSRYFGNPWMTQPILKHFPELKLTCDFSHWVCIAERLLPDCCDIIQLAADHCHHIHARVGHEQGPQVSDPRAPEWQHHLHIHEGWWDVIRESQLRRGLTDSPLCPEFGPAPYQHLLPYTLAPTADLADICDWMARRQFR